MGQNNFSEKTAIITGASRGMGVAMAKRLGKMGYNVVVNFVSDSSKSKAEDIAEAIKSEYGVDSISYQADVSDYDQAKKMIEYTVNRYGGLNCLVNNAGTAHPGMFADLKKESIDHTIKVDLMGVLYPTHCALPYLLKDGVDNPVIINTASVGASLGQVGLTDYCACKGGVVAFARSLALEYAPKLRVNCVSPGTTRTELLEATLKTNPEIVNSTLKVTPMHPVYSMAEPDDIADAMEYLINARFVTGFNLNVNGGTFMN